jgi:hypothetical protein
MKNCRKPGASFLIGITALSFSALSVWATPLAYEGFDYPEDIGTSVGGLNGGSGWDNAFPVPNNADLTLSSGLNYPGLTTVGKAMRYGVNANLGSGRDWADSSTSLSDGTYWYSFLATPELNGRGTFMIFKSTGSGDGQNGFGLRIDNNSGSPQFKAWSPQQAGGANLDFSGGYGLTYFVLGKVEINSSGNSLNTLWVYQDPTAIPSSEPNSGGSTVSQLWTSGAVGADTLRPTLSGRAFSNNTGLNYDEIRIGTDFADVVPLVVPEPSSAALLLAGLGLATRFLRRR